MDVRLQPQCFARRQPGAPQAETRVAEHPPFRRRPAWAPVLCLQTTQMGRELLQMHDSLLELGAWRSRVRRRPLTGLHDLVAGDFLMLHVMPEPAQCRQSRRRRVQSPADAPLPAGDPPRSEEHTSELQSRLHLVCRLLLEKKKKKNTHIMIKDQIKSEYSLHTAHGCTHLYTTISARRR